MPGGSREGTMPSYWIVKTEPSTYSYDDLERQKTAVWDGVRNNLALKHLRQMRPGDRVLVYHSGEQKAVVGVAEVTAAAYPDPKQKDPKLVVVDLRVAGGPPPAGSPPPILKEHGHARPGAVALRPRAGGPPSPQRNKQLPRPRAEQ